MATSISIPRKAVAYRNFWQTSEAIGLFEGKTSDGVKVLTTAPYDLKADISRPGWAQVQPSSGLAPVPLPSTQVLFRVSRGVTTGRILEAYLDWTVAEVSGGGGASVTPICFPFLFNRIDCGVQNTATPVVSLWPEMLYSSFQMASNEDMVKYTFANQLNMSPSTFGGETAIASGQSVTYSMPLFNWFAIGEVNPGIISGDMLVSCYMNSTPLVASAGGGVYNQTGAQMRIRYAIDPAYSEIRDRLQRTLPTLIDAVAFPIQQYPVTLTAGSQTRILLTGMTDWTAGMSVFIRQTSTMNTMTPVTSAGVTAPGIRNFIALEGPTPNLGGFIDVLTSAGTSLFGIQNIITPAYLRSQDMVGPKSKGIMSSVVPFYNIWFPEGDGFTRVLDEGSSNGGFLFDGTQTLVLQPSATYGASGIPVTITVLPYTYTTILQYPSGLLQWLGDGAIASAPSR